MEKEENINKVEDLSNNEIPIKNNEFQIQEPSELITNITPIILEEKNEIKPVTEETQLEKIIEEKEAVETENEKEKEDKIEEKKPEELNCEEKIESKQNFEEVTLLEKEVTLLENNQNTTQIEETKEAIFSEPIQEHKVEENTKIEESLSKYEEGLALIGKKYSDKLNQFRNQLANSGGNYFLFLHFYVNFN